MEITHMIEMLDPPIRVETPHQVSNGQNARGCDPFLIQTRCGFQLQLKEFRWENQHPKCISAGIGCPASFWNNGPKDKLIYTPVYNDKGKIVGRQVNYDELCDSSGCGINGPPDGCYYPGWNLSCTGAYASPPADNSFAGDIVRGVIDLVITVIAGSCEAATEGACTAAAAGFWKALDYANQVSSDMETIRQNG
jgi:hypothetical protein